jgi:hypothetical protein
VGDQLYYHPAEAAYPLTRAEWALARAGYYKFMGVPRDPSLPLLAPPGDVVARRITSLADTRSWVRAPEYQFAAPADDAPLRLGLRTVPLPVADDPSLTDDPVLPQDSLIPADCGTAGLVRADEVHYQPSEMSGVLVYNILRCHSVKVFY